MSDLAFSMGEVDKHQYYMARLRTSEGSPCFMQPIQFTYDDMFQRIGSALLHNVTEIVELGPAIGPNNNGSFISAVVDSIANKYQRSNNGYSSSIIIKISYSTYDDGHSRLVSLIDVPPALLIEVCEEQPIDRATKELTKAIKRAILDDMMQRSPSVSRSDEYRITSIQFNIPMIRHFLSNS